MGSSRIEELIEEIYEFVESCKMQPLSSTKVIVPKDDLYDLLDELRLRTPDEVKKFQKIIANRDAILSDAEAKANAMIREAEGRVQQMISDHEITQEAYSRADSIVSQASADAQQILGEANEEAAQVRRAAMSYTGDMMTSLESILSTAVNDTQTYYDNLLSALQANLNTVVGNRQELYGSSYEAADPVEAIMNEAPEERTEEFDDADFMKHVE